MTRLAVLGGSAVSTPQLATALADEGVSIHVALAGRSPEKLDLVAEAFRRAADGTLEVSAHTDPASALEGADLVLIQVRIGGLESRAFDERYARDLGIPGEETVGPGGFALAWRTLPALAELFEVCREVAPTASVVNLSNPAGMVHRVATRFLPTITVCDAPIVLAQRAAALLGGERRDATARYAGLNHCGWLTGLELDGRDELPAVLEHLPELAELTGVDADLIAALASVPNPYLRFVYHPERQLRAQQQRPATRADDLKSFEQKALDAYAAAEPDLAAVAAQRPAPWYEVAVVPLVRALSSGAPLTTIVNVTNDGLLAFLPGEATVEVAADVVGGEVRPRTPDSLPADARAILEGVAAFDLLATDSILAADRVGCVRALAAHPLVGSVDVARELVDRVERRFGPLGEAVP